MSSAHGRFALRNKAWHFKSMRPMHRWRSKKIAIALRRCAYLWQISAPPKPGYEQLPPGVSRDQYRYGGRG